MNVYLVSSNENVSLAENIFAKLKDVKFISTPNWKEYSTATNRFRTTRHIREADIIVVMIDDNFKTNSSLTMELGFILGVIKDTHKIVLPIVINGASVPETLNGYIWVKYDSYTDIHKIRVAIDKLLSASRKKIK